jgi:hypothetical protein
VQRGQVGDGPGGVDAAAGLHGHQVGVEAAKPQRCRHRRVDRVRGQAAVQEQDSDEDPGAGRVAQGATGGVPEPLMRKGERPRRPKRPLVPSRRLMEWAERPDATIIEDDYDAGIATIGELL